MPLTSGSLSSRVWRVTDPLPARFQDELATSLKRYAFRPVDPEKGKLQSMGWVNLRQVLDTRLTPTKVLFHNVIALALRVDRITINQRLFRATLAQEIAKVLRERRHERITREQRTAIEDQVRNELIKNQPPSMAIHEMGWHLESGRVLFGATGDKINAEFSELFTQTFSVGIEPQFPFIRAERWAKRQNQERDLLEALPAPFSPRAPAEVVVVGEDEPE